MREIIFRGKRKNGKWIEGDLFHVPNGETAIMANGYAYIMPKTVGQYTGLNDKNGKRIFEGDIVKAKLDGGAYKGFEWPKGVVVYKGTEFGLDMGKAVISLSAFAPTVVFEVIGNIYDNPELLEM